MSGIVLYNLRLGLATNSSSSHSLIFIANYSDYSYDFDYDELSPDTPVDGEFGWDTFTLRRKDEKRHYLGVVLENALSGFPTAMRRILMRELIGLSPTGDNAAYIDHQSMPTLPRDFHNPDYIDVEFWKAVRDFILQPGIYVLGGNDNGGEHPMLVGSPNKPDAFDFPPETESWCVWVARYDPENDYWMLFNRDNGAKLRFAFEDFKQPEKPASPTKAFAPELVDIKITDYCPAHCAFCYMGSTEEGKHGEMKYIYSVINSLSLLKVPEVAFGGGEPTSHPDFSDILRWTREANIIPNFTTRDLDWIKDDERRNEILKYAGAFAFSVSTSSQIEQLVDVLDTYNISRDRVNLHIVMGTCSEAQFERMLKTAWEKKMRVTLLGYKTTGRGDEYEPTPYGWWLEVINRLRDHDVRSFMCPTISIDTVLASQYEDEIVADGIPRWLFHTEDGGFSAYIDAVNQTMSRASYVEGESYPLVFEKYYSAKGENAEILKQVWHKF